MLLSKHKRYGNNSILNFANTRIIIPCMLLIVFFCSNYLSYGQSCTVGCSSPPTRITRTITSTSPDCRIVATFDLYDCGGVPSIVLIGVTYQGSCDPTTMRSLDHYENNLNALSEYLTLCIVEDYAYSITNSLPNCNLGTPRNVINIYTASCGVWVYCEYEVSDNAPVCPNWEGPTPEFGSNPKKVRVYKWQPCGTTCCRRTYSFCWTQGVAGYTGITATSSVPVKVTPCTGQSTYSPTYTCEDGCSW